jgi:hypothetical protein
MPPGKFCLGAGNCSRLSGTGPGAVETLGGGVTDGELVTLDDILQSLARWGVVLEDSVVPSCAVPRNESARPPNLEPSCSLFEGRVQPIVGPNVSSSMSHGGEILVWVRCVEDLRGTGIGEEVVVVPFSVTSSAKVTVFFEPSDSAETVRLPDLRLDLRNVCPSLGFNSFFVWASRLCAPSSSDSQAASASPSS